MRESLLADFDVGGLVVDPATNRILVAGSTADTPGASDPDRLLGAASSPTAAKTWDSRPSA